MTVIAGRFVGEKSRLLDRRPRSVLTHEFKIGEERKKMSRHPFKKKESNIKMDPTVFPLRRQSSVFAMLLVSIPFSPSSLRDINESSQ